MTVRNIVLQKGRTEGGELTVGHQGEEGVTGRLSDTEVGATVIQKRINVIFIEETAAPAARLNDAPSVMFTDEPVIAFTQAAAAAVVVQIQTAVGDLDNVNSVQDPRYLLGSGMRLNLKSLLVVAGGLSGCLQKLKKSGGVE